MIKKPMKNISPTCEKNFCVARKNVAQATARLCDLELTIFELARERDIRVFLQESSCVDSEIEVIIQSLLRVKTSIEDVVKEIENER